MLGWLGLVGELVVLVCVGDGLQGGVDVVIVVSSTMHLPLQCSAGWVV